MKYRFCLLFFSLLFINVKAQKNNTLKFVSLKTVVDSSKGVVYQTWLDKNPFHHDSLYIYFKVHSINDSKTETAKMLTAFITKNNNLIFNAVLSLAVDKSNSEFKSRIYLAWSDCRYGKQESDVFIIYSDNLGDDWTEPILLTYHPNHSQQFYPQLFLDNKSAEINVVYFDKQNYVSSHYTDIFLAKSKNGGLKWQYYKLNQKPLLGKKNQIKLHEVNNFYELEWLNNKTKFQIQLTDSFITKVGLQMITNEIELEKTYSYDSEIVIPIKCHQTLQLDAMLTKPLDPSFKKIIFKNKLFNAGANRLIVNLKKLGIPKGNYVLTLYFNNKNTYVWITE
jgi:hypothetical protein